MKVYIMRGLPGSGKSTYVQQHFPDACIISSDQNFMINGEYQFDARKLPESHNKCLRRYAGLIPYPLTSKQDIIVIDNTNIRIFEIAPYYRLAEAFNREVEILFFPCTIEQSLKRNTHNVPEHTIKRMAEALSLESLPTWWRVREVNI